MKIAQLTPYFFPHTGGTEKYVKDISLGLTARGHDVTIICCNLPVEKNAPARETIDGVKIIRLPAVDTFYLPIAKEFNLSMLDEFDLLHVHCPPFGFLRTLTQRKDAKYCVSTNKPIVFTKNPIVATYHCDVTLSEKAFGLPVPFFISKAVEGIANITARGLLSKANKIISTSSSYAATSPVLKQFQPEIIPIGIHFEVFDEMRKKLNLTQENRRKNQILFVGRLAANKGVHYLIESIPTVLKEFCDAHFIIAGEGEEKNHLVSMIKKFKIENSVTFYGITPLEILTHLYATSSVFVLPSINRLEAFGIVQLEAMANSTAVIASDIPGVNSVMEEGQSGILIPPKKPKYLAEAIISLLSDPKKAVSMGSYGRKLVEEKYNWNSIISRIEGVYQKASKI